MTTSSWPLIRQNIRDQHRQVLRNTILEAAERLANDRHGENVKVSDIAAEAGVSAGTLYCYFKKKEDIFAAVLGRRRACFLEHLQRQHDSDDPIAMLAEFIRRALRWLEESWVTDRNILVQSSEPQDLSGDCLLTILGHEDREVFQRLLEAYVERALSAIDLTLQCSIEEVTWYLLLMVRASLRDWAQFDRPEPPSVRTPLLLQLLLGGIAGARGLNLSQGGCWGQPICSVQ